MGLRVICHSLGKATGATVSGVVCPLGDDGVTGAVSSSGALWRVPPEDGNSLKPSPSSSKGWNVLGPKTIKNPTHNTAATIEIIIKMIINFLVMIFS